MRDIKFRAWDKWNKEWFVFEDSLEFDQNGFVNQCRLTNWEDVRYELSQYTGLQDRNGKDIYEGDIVRILYTDWPSNTDSKITLEDYMVSISRIGFVEYLEDRYLLNFGEDKYGWDSTGTLFEGTHGRKEVIGNIYQNPELLNNQ